MLTPMTRTLLALDGNSVLHRSFHSGARTGYRTPAGRPGWAVRGLLDQLVAAVDRSGADAVVVGFDDPDASVRRERWPNYKAQRADKPLTLTDQLADAAELLTNMGIPVVIPPGLEADDVLAAAATTAREAGWQAVLATSDRDAFALIDDTTRVLRIINGGVEASPMLTPQRLEILTGVTPQQYRDLAALRGDPSDNLPGIRGIGKVLGARLLAEFGSGEAVFADINAGGERCRSCAGPSVTTALAAEDAYARWTENLEVMTPDPSTTVPGDVFDTRLPLPPKPVRRGFASYGLSARQALRILCGEYDPAPHSPQVSGPGHPDGMDGWRPSPPSIRKFAPLPKKAPVLQDTLF